VVKPTVGMPEGEDEFRCGQFAGQADHNAVDRPLTFHLDPVPAPSDLRAIRPLRDHSFDVGQGQPRVRELRFVSLIVWPASGNAGVAGEVHQSPYSIGYVELIHALQNGLGYAMVRNSFGNWMTRRWKR
jgi:hypothetical protein